MNFKITTTEYFIKLASSALNETAPPPPEEGIDWNELFEYSKYQLCEDVLYPAIEKLESFVDEQVFLEWQKARFRTLLSESTYDEEREKLVSEFEKNNIDYMIMKGAVIKHFYPQTSMRYMADNDILCAPDRLKDVDSIMLKNGFRYNGSHGYTEIYEKNGIVCFEIHRSLILVEAHYFDYYENLWDRLVKCSENSHEYKMTDEDFYIYSIVHFAKHRENSGCGIKFLIDQYVLMKHFKDSLNRDYVDAELKKLGLFEFEALASSTAQKLFSPGNNPLFAEEGAFADELIGEYVFGSRKQEIGEGKTKIGFILSRLFPSKKEMYYYNPELKKKPYLLLWYYIKRIFVKLPSRANIGIEELQEFNAKDSNAKK